MRIVIAEDSPLLRDGLVQLLDLRGHSVLEAVGDGPGLQAAVARHRPDLAVVDVRMPPTHTDEGLRAAIAVRRAHPRVGIVVFSQYVETHYARQLLAESSTGVGYLLKDRVAHIDDFIENLQRVADGGTALDPEVISRLMGAGNHHDALAQLTPREARVLGLMAEGRSNASIATDLGISQRAVEKHVANILTKLDLPPSSDTHRRVLAVLRYLQD